MASREDVVRKVQALWNQADDKGVTEAEKASFLAKASELMAKYEIEELELAGATATEEAIVMTDIRLFRDDHETVVADERSLLGSTIAYHNRCFPIITHLPASVDADGKPIYAGTYLRIHGFKSDTQNVRLLYKGLCEDMLDALSMEPTDHIKQGRGAKAALENFQAEWCTGFVMRVDERLREIEDRLAEMAESHEGGSLLPALRSRKDQVEEKVRKMYPNLKTVPVRRREYDFNARARGRQAAEGTDIGQTKVGPSRKAIG